MSAFADVDGIPPQQIWAGLTGRTVHGEEMTLSLIEIEPNAVVPEHSHDNEQMGILLQGSMRFRIGGEEREIHPGCTWTIRANVPHSVVGGPDGTVLVEVFSPPRHDWHGLETHEPGSGRWP